MHENSLLTSQGVIWLGASGAALFALAAAALAWLLIRGSSEDDDVALAPAVDLFASRPDDKERRDGADAEGVVSTVRLELTRDLHRRPSASVQRLRAESREGRPVPPRAA
jgi:hypothetical protein